MKKTLIISLMILNSQFVLAETTCGKVTEMTSDVDTNVSNVMIGGNKLNIDTSIYEHGSILATAIASNLTVCIKKSPITSENFILSVLK